MWYMHKRLSSVFVGYQNIQKFFRHSALLADFNSSDIFSARPVMVEWHSCHIFKGVVVSSVSGHFWPRRLICNFKGFWPCVYEPKPAGCLSGEYPRWCENIWSWGRKEVEDLSLAATHETQPDAATGSCKSEMGPSHLATPSTPKH